MDVKVLKKRYKLLIKLKKSWKKEQKSNLKKFLNNFLFSKKTITYIKIDFLIVCSIIHK